nr:retrovirus-related Pol polyprotein from transposon TNT 1-94 [Tanacetum cinerariifolium]
MELNPINQSVTTTITPKIELRPEEYERIHFISEELKSIQYSEEYQRLWGYITSSYDGYKSQVAPAGQQVAPEILAAHKAWIKGSKKIVGVMIMTMDPEIQRNLEPLHAHEMLWEQEEGQSVSTYFHKMKGYIDNLKRLGYPVTLGLGVSLILIGLRKEYDGFLQNYNMHSMGKTVNELHAMLKLHEQTLPKSNALAVNAIRYGKVQKGNKHKKSQSQIAAKGQNRGKGKNKQAYAPKPKIPPPPKRENLIKDSICYECDVCDPFKIMSIQGASYFVTFTDDFIRYGYVYLLKHKHEVFKTFKAFRKEDHGIIAHRTPPYTPQHNGVLERINRTLLDMVRSMMSQTTLPKSFWDYALENAARILNMVPTKKATRTRHAPDRMCLYIDAEEHELGDLEMQSMKDNEVWILVELPPNGKTIGSKWLFKKKTDMDRNIHTYKARLVAKGYTQTPWIDYEETFSSVAEIRAIRILIAIAAYYNYQIWQMDVKTSFLNGYLNEEVYMEQPEGFVNPKYPNRFHSNRNEPCVYLKASGSNITFLILYVDDILIMRNNIPMLQSVKTYLGRCFANKDLGEAAYILGIKIYRDRSRRLIGLCQSAYIEKSLKRYCMENSKRGSIPMQEKLKLSKSQGASTPAELKRMQNVPYASAVGSIMVSCYTDAGYLTDADDLKSQTRYVFFLNGGAVDWKSAKQSIFATSSAKAKYIAAFDASKEAVWVRKFIFGLGVVLTIEEPISMYCDNTGAIAITNESGITKGARHFPCQSSLPSRSY